MSLEHQHTYNKCQIPWSIQEDTCHHQALLNCSCAMANIELPTIVDHLEYQTILLNHHIFRETFSSSPERSRIREPTAKVSFQFQ